MTKRRSFLTTVVAVSTAGLALPMAAKARSAEAAVAPAPSSAKVPSAAALAFALTFRAFDAALSDAEVETIARNIDASRTAAAKLHPRSKPLPNSAEMVARFAAAESV